MMMINFIIIIYFHFIVVCAEASGPCYDVCCSNDTSTDCRLDSQPTKDLLARVEACSYRDPPCPRQLLGWTYLTYGHGCSQFGRWSTSQQINSQWALLNYYCIAGLWLLFLNVDDPESLNVRLSVCLSQTSECIMCSLYWPRPSFKFRHILVMKIINVRLLHKLFKQSQSRLL